MAVWLWAWKNLTPKEADHRCDEKDLGALERSDGRFWGELGVRWSNHQTAG